MTFLSSKIRKIRLLMNYIKMNCVGWFEGERITRYRGCFIYHEPRNTLIERYRKDGHYEPFLENFCDRFLPDDGVFVDVGANIGLISLPLLQSKSNAKALLFEPSPAANQLLKKSVEANGLSNRVFIFPFALAQENKEDVPFEVNDHEDRSMDGLLFTGRTKGSKTILVQARTLDEVVRMANISRIDLVKLDCEGAEVLVLRGALQTLKRFHPIIITEFAHVNYSNYHLTARDLFDWGREANYLILSTNMEVLDLFNLEIRIGLRRDDEFILIPSDHVWRGI